MAIGLDNAGFSDALVILGAAGLVIPAFARFRVSPVIGFILVGMLVGPFGLGQLTTQAPWLYYLTISNPHSIEPFAEFGIILLLFSIGLELSFKRLWAMRAQVFGTGPAELIGSAVLIAIAVHLLGQDWAGAAGLGLALALSSTALVLPLVGTTSPVGRGAFAMLLFEDLALVPIIFALGAMAPTASEEGWVGIAGVALRGAATVVVMYLGGRLVLPRLFAQAARTKSPELFLAASLLVVIVASVATTAAGLSPIVGALLAGLLIAETEYHTEVEVMTAPFKGLALGVFLITVGMSVNLREVLDNWPALLTAVVAVVGVKAVVTFLLLRVAHAYQQATDWHTRHPQLSPGTPQPALVPKGNEPVAADMDNTTRDYILQTAQRAGLRLNDRQTAILLETAPFMLAMAERIRKPRERMDEPALVFRFPSGDCQ